MTAPKTGVLPYPLLIYFRGQRAKRTCWHVHLAVLCASGTCLAPTEVEHRPAARL